MENIREMTSGLRATGASLVRILRLDDSANVPQTLAYQVQFLLSKVKTEHSGETVACHKYSSAILEYSAYREVHIHTPQACLIRPG